MKCINCFILTITYLITVNAFESKINEQIRSLIGQIEELKTLHLTDITRLKRELEEIRSKCVTNEVSNLEQNEKSTLEWATTAVREIRLEVREIGRRVNNTDLLRQLHNIHNQLKRALGEGSDLAKLAHIHEARVDKVNAEIERLKYEFQQMRTVMAEFRSHIGKLAKELKAMQVDYLNPGSFNEAIEANGGEAAIRTRHRHKIRHSKMVHTQISRLSRSQDQLDEYQQSLQTQIMDIQRRLDRCEEPNWNLLSAKLDMLELEMKYVRTQLKNVSQNIDDFEKVHTSLLELREDVENIENKADKTVPEFRKEISKLDVNVAKLSAHASYLKEDQDNLRQSVKAIAVGVSNAVDRADLDREMLNKINQSIANLNRNAKMNHHRLNDHIFKTEANKVEQNMTEPIPMPELMGEVKELQVVHREYEDLVKQLPKDCSGVVGPAGTYLIHPGHAPLDAWCVNGGTLLQRRYNGTIEFNRKFKEYVEGFGIPSSEYWLGLEAMHLLTADNCSSMRIDMSDIYGAYWYAQYEHFSVSGSDDGYKLDVSGFNGNASDAFEYQNHMEFSAIDRDRDISNTNCAGNYEGGWWFSHCQHVNINGKYNLGLTWFDSGRNEWIAVATSEMVMYRRPDCA